MQHLTVPDTRIASLLEDIEKHRRVRILYACESGSRAWGLASSDSDLNVRFINVHHRDWYLSIRPHRDVIELPIQDDLDINGWELRKTLRLLQKSNPVLLEWLESPICYRCDEGFMRLLRPLARSCYSPKACFHHYLHMAQGNWRTYLQGPEVWLKKYFYVLRSLPACLWIKAGLGSVPVVFKQLVEGVVKDESLLGAIDRLVERKCAGDEIGMRPAVPEINAFFRCHIPRV